MNTSIKSFIIPIVSALVFSGSLVAYSFTEPSLPAPQASLTAALNNSDLTQKKEGGLVVNAAVLGGSGAGIGLSVDGFVGIGLASGQSATAALDLLGNFFISGAIKSFAPGSGNSPVSGSNDQVLSITDSGDSMEWRDRYTWLSLTTGSQKANTCPNGQIDPGENCSNCPDATCPAGLVCWVGNCVNPSSSSGQACGDGICDLGENCCADCGGCASTCGDATFNATQEACDPTGGPQGQCRNASFICNHDPNANVPPVDTQTVCASCQCVLDPLVDHDCDVDPPPPPGGCVTPSDWDGVSPPVCDANATCPDPDEYCASSAGAGCFCTPIPAQQQGNELEVKADYENYIAQWNGITTAEASSHLNCSALPNPPQCPNQGNWQEYNEVCAELADGSLIRIRNCYEP
ncbi:MAG: hypothetical protein AAB518_01930 [Patescibacteria group bacterium]